MKTQIFDSLYQSMSVVYRHGKVLHDNSLKHFSLTGQQMMYLKFIRQNPGIPQESLAREMKIDKGAVAKAIKDMVDKGYVKRTQNPQDKRAYCLSVTDKAEQICRDAETCAANFENEITSGMSEEEIETFERLLKKITANLSRIMEKGDL